jgi:hypothetical protein
MIIDFEGEVDFFKAICDVLKGRNDGLSGFFHQISVLFKSSNLILIPHLEEMRDRLARKERLKILSLFPHSNL